MNTTKIVNEYKDSIQREIDMKQQVLNDISKSMKEAESFLLDNGYEVIKQDEDVICCVMDKIVEIKIDAGQFKKDIDSVEQSIKILSGISNGIDPDIHSSLEDKISDLNKKIEAIDEKLSETQSFLPTILNLQIVCPSCNGSTQINKKPCHYCNGVGVIGIDKIFKNDNNAKPNPKDEDFNSYRIQRT